ncbi:MAG: iron-containing alcohol dehydrogenase [Bacillota bacterium]
MELEFWLPTRVVFGKGILKQAAQLIGQALQGKRVFLVTDQGVASVGIVSPLLDQLTEAGYVVEVFDKVQPNPRDVDCDEGGKAIRLFGADIVLAVGGGSVLDSSKAISLLSTHDGSIRDYEGRNRLVRDVTPIVAVPTTAGTGSEVTRSAVITDTSRKFKMTVKDPRLAPRLALVDPETTYTLPRQLTASTGMDALVHALEAFTSRKANPFSDAWASQALQLIFPNLRPAVQHGDRSARDKLMLGSVMAGVAFSHADVGAVHCMAEALGGIYDTPHGIANSVFLPVVTEFNLEADPEKHGQAARLCGLDIQGLTPIDAGKLLVSQLYELSRDIGIPRLRELGYVNPADFQALAQRSFVNGSTPSNCRAITEQDYLELFEKAYSL